MITNYPELVRKAALTLSEKLKKHKPDVVVVLGSGMKEALNKLSFELEISFDEIPGFITPKVMGHVGKMTLCIIDNKKVLFVRGRKHLYEGTSYEELTFPIRVFGEMGLKNIILTNAAGSLNKDYKPGELMLINNHINFQGSNPLVGPNHAHWGPRFPDMSHPYSKSWIKAAHEAAKDTDLNVHEGVYVSVLGPSFETAHEIKLFAQWGGDAVGMSTVPEVIVARHMNINVMGLSMISNFGAGISDQEVNHDEVMDLGLKVAPKMIDYIVKIISKKN